MSEDERRDDVFVPIGEHIGAEDQDVWSESSVTCHATGICLELTCAINTVIHQDPSDRRFSSNYMHNYGVLTSNKVKVCLAGCWSYCQIHKYNC